MPGHQGVCGDDTGTSDPECDQRGSGLCSQVSCALPWPLWLGALGYPAARLILNSTSPSSFTLAGPLTLQGALSLSGIGCDGSGVRIRLPLRGGGGPGVSSGPVVTGMDTLST